MTTWDAALAKHMWEVENKSSGQIARHFGLTRNAVIGRLRRAGVEPKNIPPKPKKPLKFKHCPHPKGPQPMPEMKPAVVSNPTRLIDANSNQCRWILDGHAEPTVCGAPGFPWCAEHRGRIYSAVGPRKELEAA